MKTTKTNTTTNSASPVEEEVELVFDDSPPPKPNAPTFTFRCDRYPKLLVAPSGQTLARFEDGKFVTDDERVANRLRALALEDVTEEEG